MSNIRSGVLAVLLAAAAAACSGKSGSAPLADDLAGDLDAARSSSVQLAPSGVRGTDVVSAEELIGPGAGKPRRGARRRSLARSRSPSSNAAATAATMRRDD